MLTPTTGLPPHKVLVVLPRNMYFGEAGATSIDLTVRDLIEHGPVRVECTVAVAHGGECFPEHNVLRISDRSTTAKVVDVLRYLRANACDVVVVQQHLPTAAALASRTTIPVILHTHNFQKSITKKGILSGLRRAIRVKRYNRLAGIIHVSNACQDHFRHHWPEFEGHQAVVYNGLDMRLWNPGRRRERTILCVARNVPEKGVLEAARATQEILERYPEWRATFILSESAPGDPYAQETLTILRANSRIKVLLNQPHKVVHQACETAAIALVPSVWREPFGRTALEAHAGGCAVISSGTGGLAEVSGGHARLVESVGQSALSQALRELIEDPNKRLQLAAAGRSFVEAHFDIGTVARTFFDFCVERARAGEGISSLKASP